MQVDREKIKIAMRRAKPKVSQKKLAELTGYSKNVVDNLLSGRTPFEAHPDFIEKVREVLKIPVEIFPTQAIPPEGHLVSLAGTPLAPLKVVGDTGAGEGETNVDVYEDELYVPASLAGEGRLGWRVQGDSMMPFLEPGDIAVFQERRMPRSNYVFLLTDEDRQFRSKIIKWEGTEFKVKSLNPNYKTESLRNLRIEGVLVGIYRRRSGTELVIIDPDGLRPDLEIIPPAEM